MSTLDYSPVLDGDPYDPAPAGGTVDNLQLFDTPDRDGTALNTGVAAVLAPGVYRFTINDAMVPAGRYWARVLWTPATGDPQLADDLTDALDMPVRTDLVVAPAELGARLGLAAPLASGARESLTDAILDAQSDVEAYLGRPILPRITTERRAWPVHRADLRNRPVLAIYTETEITDEIGFPTGYWDITYRGGLDARTDPELRPIRRLVLALAAQADEAVRLWATVGYGAASEPAGLGAIRMTGLTTESQSVSYAFGRPGDGGTVAGGRTAAFVPGAGGAIGGPLKWSSIDDWRLRGRRVFSRTGYRAGGLVGGSVDSIDSVAASFFREGETYA